MDDFLNKLQPSLSLETNLKGIIFHMKIVMTSLNTGTSSMKRKACFIHHQVKAISQQVKVTQRIQFMPSSCDSNFLFRGVC